MGNIKGGGLFENPHLYPKPLSKGYLLKSSSWECFHTIFTFTNIFLSPDEQYTKV